MNLKVLNDARESFKKTADLLSRVLDEQSSAEEAKCLFNQILDMLRTEFPLTAPHVGESFKALSYIQGICKKNKELAGEVDRLKSQLGHLVTEKEALWAEVDGGGLLRKQGLKLIDAVKAHVAVKEHNQACQDRTDSELAYSLLAERGVAWVPSAHPLTSTLRKFLADMDSKKGLLDVTLCNALQALRKGEW